jgi:integrase
VKITKRSVDALKPAAERYTVWDTEIAGFGVRVAPSGKKTYVLKYRVGGGRAARVRWGSIGAHGAITPDQARDLAREWAADVAGGGDPAGDRLDKRQAPTVSKLLDDYISRHVEKKNKAKTISDVKRLVERVIRPALGKLKVADVTTADVDHFHSAQSHTPYEANRAVAFLSKAFTLAETWGLRPNYSNPCRKVQRFEEKARERFLTAEEFAALSEALGRAERGALMIDNGKGKLVPAYVGAQAILTIRLLIFTGARVGEMLAMRWEYVDFAGGRANLPDSKTGKKVVQLAGPALDLLALAAPPENRKGYVIRGADGSDPEVRLINISAPWTRIRKAAGLAELRLHDLRHAFASVAVTDGISLPMIGALLGHREASTTQRYAHLANDPQRAAAAQVAGLISAAMAPQKNSGKVDT